MKFLKKINRNYILLLTIILVMVSVGGFLILNHIINTETRESLLEKEGLIKDQITKTGEIPYIYPLIIVRRVDSTYIEKPLFREIYINNREEDEQEKFIEYSNQLIIKGNVYSVKIRQPTFESEDLLLILSVSLFVLLLSGLAISILISRKLNKTVWTNFEENLKRIEKFSLSEHKSLDLLKSDIDEFDRLNSVLNRFTEKLKSDYLSLKEFTENASHEIQTPLFIILCNLEEVLQQELSEDTFKKVVSCMNAVKRLSTLNQSLILLTKIENRQFSADKEIFMNDIIQHKLAEYGSLIETKKIKVNLQIEQNFSLKMNEQLAELLIGNLLSNAVYHNTLGGNIEISVRQKELKICNTGEPNTLTNATIFNRFSKGNSKSYGLGLAIVKNICDTHQLEIEYQNKELHCFTIHPKF